MLMMTPAEENALRLEVEALQKKVALMQQLSSTSGFFDYYFKNIVNYKSRRECFDAINELHFKLFFRYRYSDYLTFKAIISRNYKPKKS